MEQDTPDAVDSTAEEEGPTPELRPAVDDLLPVVTDPGDQHEVMVRMDEADVALLLSQVQGAALRKWIYDLPGNKGTGLTVHAVQDIVQRMNWTGKARIGLLRDERGRPVLDVEQITADEGDGPEPFWVATAYAVDAVTDMVLPGSSMEPQRMKLKADTADKKRRAGASIPKDNKVFDRFSRQKAIQKATRNALGSFIPEEIEQTVIAMFLKDASRVQRIRSEAEAKVAELPPPLDDEEARGLIAQCEAVYDEIKGLGAGQGKVLLTPGTYNAWLLQSQHDHGALRRMLEYLAQRRDEIAKQFEEA